MQETSTTQSGDSPDEPLQCRPTWFFLVLATLWLPYGLGLLLIPLSPSPSEYRDLVGEWSFALFFAIPSICLWLITLARTLRARITTTESGIQWRGLLGPWKSVAWTEVTDFYYPHPTYKSHWRVETEAGHFGFSKNGWSQAEQLAEMIPIRASKAKTQTWDFKGERLVDEWPQRFTYRSPRGLLAIFAWAYSALCFCTCGILACVFWQQPAVAAFTPDRIRFAGLGVAALSLLFGLVLTRIAYHAFRRWISLRKVTISITPTHIEWSRPEETKTLAWAQVQELRRGRSSFGHYELVHNNSSISFYDGLLSPQYTVIRLVERFAPHLPVQRIREGAEAALGPESSNIPAPTNFHYRTSSTRALVYVLCLAPFVCWVPLIVNLSPESMDMTPHPSLGILLLLGPLPILTSALSIWVYSRSCLLLSDAGLERRILSFHSGMSWSQLKVFGRTASGVYVSDGMRRLNLEPGIGIAYPSDLLQEIARRAPQAKREDSRT